MKKKIALLLMSILMLSGCGVNKNDNGDYVLYLWEQEEENISDVSVTTEDLPVEDIYDPEVYYPDDIDEGFLIDVDEIVNPYWERKESTNSFGKYRVKLKDVKSLDSMWDFCINNTVISMPCSIQDLVNAGCVIEPPIGADYIQETVPANYSNFLVELYTEQPNGELLYLHAMIDNMSDHSCSIYNRTVYSLNIFPFSSESTYRKFNFYVADGVSFDNKYYDAYDYYVEDPSDDDY